MSSISWAKQCDNSIQNAILLNSKTIFITKRSLVAITKTVMSDLNWFGTKFILYFS
jgi:hypothetical protein